MKIRRILVAMCALFLVSMTMIGIGVDAKSSKASKTSKALSNCDKAMLQFMAKHGKGIAAFTAKYSKRFDANAALNALNAINSGQVSDAAEADKLVRMRFKTLAPDQKRAVWIAKFNRLSEDDFTPDQFAFIQKVKGLVETLKFDGTDDGEAVGKEVYTGKHLFGRRQMYHLFGTLKPASGDIETGKIKGPDQNGATYQKASLQTVYCNCSYFEWDDYCSWWYGQGSSCWSSGQTGCTHTFPCGTLLTGVCNGLCRN